MGSCRLSAGRACESTDGLAMFDHLYHLSIRTNEVLSDRGSAKCSRVIWATCNPESQNCHFCAITYGVLQATKNFQTLFKGIFYDG